MSYTIMYTMQTHSVLTKSYRAISQEQMQTEAIPTVPDAETTLLQKEKWYGNTLWILLCTGQKNIILTDFVLTW